MARKARVEGVVQIDAVFGADGVIECLKLISGPPLLLNAAMDAVRLWHYRPTRLNGKPMEVQAQIKVKFTPSSQSSIPLIKATPVAAAAPGFLSCAPDHQVGEDLAYVGATGTDVGPAFGCAPSENRSKEVEP